jgi:hypothetical protein
MASSGDNGLNKFPQELYFDAFEFVTMFDSTARYCVEVNAMAEQVTSEILFPLTTSF